MVPNVVYFKDAYILSVLKKGETDAKIFTQKSLASICDSVYYFDTDFLLG